MQSEKQKRYRKLGKIANKSETLNDDEKKIVNDSDDDFEANVQNLCEINYMFDKAGCGLPRNEVALISIAMNAMARLKKFKNIR